MTIVSLYCNIQRGLIRKSVYSAGLKRIVKLNNLVDNNIRQV